MGTATARTVASRRADHAEDTRRALREAARALFTERGYQATSTEEIVQRARVTRGALYHHFADKADLFAAVFDDVNDEVAATLVPLDRDEQAVDPWELYRLNNETYLDVASGNHAYRQVVLTDGPAVFGSRRPPHARRPSDDGGARYIARYVTRAIDAGVLAPQPVAPLAQLLAALGHRAVMYIAGAEDRDTARAEMGAAVDRVLQGLRTGPDRRPPVDPTGTAPSGAPRRGARRDGRGTRPTTRGGT